MRVTETKKNCRKQWNIEHCDSTNQHRFAAVNNDMAHWSLAVAVNFIRFAIHPTDNIIIIIIKSSTQPQLLNYNKSLNEKEHTINILICRVVSDSRHIIHGIAISMCFFSLSFLFYCVFPFVVVVVMRPLRKKNKRK